MNSLNEVFENVKTASRSIYSFTDDKINSMLLDLAEHAVAKTNFILEANEADLKKMPEDDPKYDRLKLTRQRIKNIADDIVSVSKLKSPLGKILMKRTLENGMKLSKVSVPLGVIGIIYEARPNVTFDVFSLTIKSGNACILKGSSDAHNSNQAIMEVIHEVLREHGFNESVVSLLPADRQAAIDMMEAVDYLDIIIPRGSKQLIDTVRENSQVPVIETGAGIVHTYFDENADLKKGINIINNAKTRRVSVCNALDCLIINQQRLEDLPAIAKPLAASQVEIFADELSYEVLKKGNYPDELLFEAKEEHFGTEFLSYKMAIKTVSNYDSAINHIYKYSSKHSEAIISEDTDIIERFLNDVDAAAVYANASTAFTDGAQFGLGAEIGISTQKLHARGPMGLDELTSYKWVIHGDGQIRTP